MPIMVNTATSISPESIEAEYEGTRCATINHPAMTASKAPMAPSQVLPGLILGASLCRPKARPKKYAAVSATQITPSASSKRPGSSCSQAAACQNGNNTTAPTHSNSGVLRTSQREYNQAGAIASQKAAHRT